MRRGRVANGETVAVFGCGPIGLGAVAGAARLGAHVIAVDLDEKRLEVVPYAAMCVGCAR